MNEICKDVFMLLFDLFFLGTKPSASHQWLLCQSVWLLKKCQWLTIFIQPVGRVYQSDMYIILVLFVPFTKSRQCVQTLPSIALDLVVLIFAINPECTTSHYLVSGT